MRKLAPHAPNPYVSPCRKNKKNRHPQGAGETKKNRAGYQISDPANALNSGGRSPDLQERGALELFMQNHLGVERLTHTHLMRAVRMREINLIGQILDMELQHHIVAQIIIEGKVDPLIIGKF